MLFNSLQFALFFPLATLLYFLLPQGMRWGLLLAASCYFYMTFVPVYILILAVTIVVDYLAALWMGGMGRMESAGPSDDPKRRLILMGSLACTVLILAFFKYFNFLNGNIAFLARHAGWDYPIKGLEIILPIGLSFHTFQSMSYVIEVYRGNQKPERHFGIYALYVMFYPQLVAGPIERPQNLLHQFREKHAFDARRVIDGLRLMLWGMFKKVVIADRLALFVDPIYDHPAGHEAPALILATYFFAFQIYCDFSGYTDIAIGAARVMGFDLMKNFNRPYAAASVADFWRRWHISLSSWFKDYLYYPLGGNRVGKARWMANIMTVFLVSGLWHGANWTYVIWGALHGIYMAAGALGSGLREKAAKAIGLDRLPGIRHGLNVLATFHLVLFAWIFFRARSLADAFLIIRTIASGAGFHAERILAAHPLPALAACLGAIAILEAAQWIHASRGAANLLTRFPAPVRWGLYLIVLLCVLNLRPAQVSPFIYFQF
ncbi:MAG: putative rane protein involved in D-alanine export [Fibrobacteres bacterium]|nr:putative rane protein involved in D-alanine export [Fibrobacterota bacterium]